MVNRIVQAVVVSFCLSLLSYTVHAQSLQNKGLFVSPSRQEIKAASGNQASGKITVYNHYTKSLHVDFSVKEFAPTGEDYKYAFQVPKENWINLAVAKEGVELQKDRELTVPFVVDIPKDAAPGDHYYALFASADMSGKGFRQTAQVASLIYITVDGGKVTRSAVLENIAIPGFIINSSTSYAFRVKNTGNVHFDGYFYARLEDWLSKYPVVGANQVVLAKSTRQINGSLPMPLLPGLYKLTYGYTTDDKTPSNTKSTYIMYVPPWSVVLLVLAGLIVTWTIQRRKSPPKG